MGGIGKTTLAKIIFNQISDRFDRSCFLENIRDCSFESPDGLHKLQVRLLKSLDPSFQDSTQIVDLTKRIQTTFKRKKVLVVLDDIEQQCHLDSLVGDSSWFGEGSKIIFTTRNAELHKQRSSSDARFYGLEKKEMNSKQALQLFCQHAFGGDSPPKDFESLSTEAISTMGGLPLALQVVGSLLHRRKAKVWREIIKQLKETPHQDVQRNLKLSYDALNDEQQEIFLDIACFFIGEEKKNAVYMWEACEFDPNYGIEVLISMSLIKLDEKKRFLMHDQLRDLGRAIVKVNSKDARAGSRLWMHNDAPGLLKINTGKGKVEALYLEGHSGYLDHENFVGLEKLRFLKLSNCGDFGGDFGSLIPKLRWLSLLNASSFNVTNLYLRQLVVLEFSSFKFDETWSGWGQILISKQLKVLTLSYCNELNTMPDLSEVMNLERLVIKYCRNLTFIQSSIRSLHRLRRLSIIGCHSLHQLPNSIGELVEIKHLSLRGSKNLRVLPDSIGDLRSLISLDLWGSGITELPTTIGRLAKLESLCLGWEFLQVPDEVEAALKLLAIGSDDVRRFVGIHGMGGIGKTTIAKIIFNQILDKFDCSCFLENIRDYLSQGPDGLHKLQERLLKSLDPSIQDSIHIVDPIEWIRMNFHTKKVIIVLDDVDQQSHLDSLVGDASWFSKGSRIIFTTRNAELHEQMSSSSDARFYGLEKKEMNSKQAFQLFSQYAFGVESPPKDFESLSTEVISKMGGFPLALEVVGSFLHRKKPKVWRDMIKNLEEAPHQDVQQKLKLRYNALDVEQQEIFLDIACFFIGVEMKNAAYMWEASKFYPNHGIEVLISLSLIKLDEKKCFLMHDQLRDLGRAIAAGSRFWRHKDAVDLLKRNVGKEKVEALNLEGPFGFLDRENFVGLDKLRFLQLTKCGDFGGDFGSLIPKLRWLSLRDVSSFNMSNLYLRELVVLELRGCGFDETWSGWGQILISKQLRVLTLSNCDELITMPDLSEVVNLERLVIEKCSKLTFIRNSIGRLHRLRRLSIIECGSLFELPESIGYLVSLTRLELQRAANLPNSIGNLVQLKHLSLSCSENLRVLPDSIGDLRSLISLDLWGSGITELPSTIGRLAKLKSLCVGICRELQSLPDSLMDLDMRGNNSIAEEPRTVAELNELKTQCRVTPLSIDQVLDGIKKSIKLNELKIQCCRVTSLTLDQWGGLYKWGGLHQWGGLQQLKELLLWPSSLEFGECQLPSNLESLHLHVKQWGNLSSNLSSMKKLRELELTFFVIEEGDWSVQELESLEVLKLRSCSFPTTCFDTSQLNHLVYLEISLCDNLVDIQGIGKLKSLKQLSISYCDSLQRIEDLSELDILASIDISRCNNLVDIQGIGKLKSLTKLRIFNCGSLQRIEDLSECNRLESIQIGWCEKFEGIEGGVDKLLSACTSLSTLDT